MRELSPLALKSIHWHVHVHGLGILFLQDNLLYNSKLFLQFRLLAAIINIGKSSSILTIQFGPELNSETQIFLNPKYHLKRRF